MNDKNLRSKLIRLAHANPELRGEILPLVSKQAHQTKTAATWAALIAPLVQKFRKEKQQLQDKFLLETVMAASDIAKDNGSTKVSTSPDTVKGVYQGSPFKVKYSWEEYSNDKGLFIVADVEWGNKKFRTKFLVESADQIASESMFAHFKGFIV